MSTNTWVMKIQTKVRPMRKPREPFYILNTIITILMFGPMVLITDAAVKILNYPSWTGWLCAGIMGLGVGWFGWFKNPFTRSYK